MGAIVRTAGKEMSERDFRNDLEYLTSEWKRIQQRMEQSSAPSLIFQNPGTIFLLIRDLISDGIEEIVVDDPRLYSSILEYVKEQAAHSVHQVTLYDDVAPIFRAYSIENEINSLRSKSLAQQRRVHRH